MTKRAQGRKRFGRRNFKQRYFRLSTQSLSYAKSKGKRPICDIPLTDLVAVERLEERSFKMQNIFRVRIEHWTFAIIYLRKRCLYHVTVISSSLKQTSISLKNPRNSRRTILIRALSLFGFICAVFMKCVCFYLMFYLKWYYTRDLISENICIDVYCLFYN